MSEKARGTSGGYAGMGGDAARGRRMLWLAGGALLFIAIQSIANVESTLDDMARAGRIDTRAHVWIWQLSSVLVWLALLPAIWTLVAWARPPRLSWPAIVAIHALATLPLSLVHVAAMVVLRQLAYAAGGEAYSFGDWSAGLLYEYRKDVATYVISVAFVAFAQWLLARPRPSDPDDGDVLAVTDGSITHRIPAGEIAWAAAAGNYVEIAWGSRVILHRSTLAALAERLGPGFARIHRGRLVRRSAIVSIETERSGDFVVTLADGTALKGSRRFRGAL